MSRISIGTIGNKTAWIDVDVLLRTRMLIQANSGKGKSWLLRRICEQLFGKVQTIVIDPEGEFATLREKFAFVLVGKGGETAAHPRIAALTAQRLLELRASAVIDLYELKAGDRHLYVKNFLGALIDAPKTLWHPLVVILDEAHVYCPEKGVAESEASEAVIDMATRGRKRGFCLIPATQRLGKLRKDMAAELLNVAIGGTFIDIDRKRAANALGVYGAKDLHAFDDQIRQLKAGLFYFLGPAVSTTRELVKVGAVETTHPEAGSAKHGAEPPPAPEKVKALLPKLADLPKEAEDKARTEAQFRQELRELKAKLAAAERQSPAPASSSKPDPAQARTIAQLQAGANRLAKSLQAFRDYHFPLIELDGRLDPAQLAGAVADAMKSSQREIAQLQRQADRELSSLGFQYPETKFPPVAAKAASVPTIPIDRIVAAGRPLQFWENSGGEAPKLGAPGRKIAGILAAHYPEAVSIKLLASMIGSSSGGYLSGRLSEVRSNGLLADPSKGFVVATEKCAREFAGHWQRPTSIEEALAVWSHKIGQKHRMMIDRLVEAGGEPVAIAELGQLIGATSGGYLSGRISELRSTGLVLDAGKGFLKANPEALFMAS